MKELKRDLLTNKYTKVYHEEENEMKYGAPHHFVVTNAHMEYCSKNCSFVFCPYTDKTECYENVLCEINFQEGPIKECGVNGVCNEDLINMVIERLERFQNTEFKCRENACAITKLEEALMWLRKRTTARENRGVEGTHTI